MSGEADRFPQVVGRFKLYPPGSDDAWAVSFDGMWLPGTYADRDAALMACGYVLGGEQREMLEELRDRLGRPISTLDFQTDKA